MDLVDLPQTLDSTIGNMPADKQQKGSLSRCLDRKVSELTWPPSQAKLDPKATLDDGLKT
jgi:hypothetical protein